MLRISKIEKLILTKGKDTSHYLNFFSMTYKGQSNSMLGFC